MTCLFKPRAWAKRLRYNHWSDTVRMQNTTVKESYWSFLWAFVGYKIRIEIVVEKTYNNGNEHGRGNSK